MTIIIIIITCKSVKKPKEDGNFDKLLKDNNKDCNFIPFRKHFSSKTTKSFWIKIKFLKLTLDEKKKKKKKKKSKRI